MKHAAKNEIFVTQEGIGMCNRMDRTGWHSKDYPMD